MTPRFLGKGWRFPILPDASGRLGYTEGEENIEHSLRILLQTALGERLMRFDFGSRAPELLFAPGAQQNLNLLESSVREAIRDWEPRVDVIDVGVETVLEEPERVQVSLEYRIRATNTRTNLVFPFYLDLLEIR